MDVQYKWKSQVQKSSCEQDFFKEHDRFPKLQTANTRKIEMIQEEIGSETKFNVNNNNNVDWLKDKADGEHFDKNHFQYKTFLCCL